MIGQEGLSSEIDRYICDDTFPYAIMINGSWGCGKTFFIKKYINESSITKNKKFIYISLYGLSSISDLNRQIKLQYLFGKKYKNKYEITKIGTSIAIDLLEENGIKRKYIAQALKLINKDTIKSNDIVLILDDLERSTVSVVDILGYINGLVEHQKYKVIILANEKEIDYELNNLELKYLVAKDTNLVEKEKDTLDYIFCSKKADETKKNTKDLDFSELKNRTQALFSEKSRYFLIKEKVIGITYMFNLDTRDTMKEILRNVFLPKVNKTDSDLYNWLFNLFNQSVDEIAKIMEKEKHQNLRTYQFYLSKVIALYKCLKESDASQNRDVESFINSYNIMMFKECLFFKLDKDQKVGLNLIENFLANYVRGFNNISDLNFTKIIWKYYDSLNSDKRIDLAINTVYNWTDWNSKKINDEIEFLSGRINEIDKVMYKRILTTFAYLEEQKIVDKDKIQKFLYELRSHINREGELKTVLQDLRYTFLETKQENNIYESYINILKMNDKNDYVMNPFESCFSEETNTMNWFDKFILSTVNYLPDSVVDQLLEKIKHANCGSELICIFNALDKVYLSEVNEWKDNPAMHDNLKSLSCFKNEIIKIYQDSELDPVIKVWIRNIIQRIDKILKKLQ